MKNKSLIGTLIVLTLLVIGSIISENKNQIQRGSKNQVVKIGILQYVTHEALDQIEKGVEDGLADGGYFGKKVKMTLMNAQADQSKIQTMSKQLVQDKNDLLIGIATPAAQGLASVTKDIPVVMGAVSDPIGAKLVKNLKKPTSNVTGLSNSLPIKQEVSLIQELTPNVKTVGVLYASNEDNSVSQVAQFEKEAKTVGLKVEKFAVPSTNEIATTMSVMTSRVDAVFVPQDNTIASAFSTVVTAAKAKSIPIYSSVDTMVKEGSIASIAQNQYQLGVETAKVAIKILSGKKVSQVPVKVVDRGTPTLNLKVARELGIDIPEKLAKKADIAVK